MYGVYGHGDSIWYLVYREEDPTVYYVRRVHNLSILIPYTTYHIPYTLYHIPNTTYHYHIPYTIYQTYYLGGSDGFYGIHSSGQGGRHNSRDHPYQ